MSSLPVFMCDPLPDEGAAVLDGPEGRHAAVVRRLRAGEHLLLADGRGGLARCEVTVTSREAVALQVQARWSEPAPRPWVAVAQALVKGDRSELAVQLATEAGADVLLPWQAARCVARWDTGARGARSLQRWRDTAREAAKQARRSRMPEVGEPVDTAALAGRVRSAALALVLHEAADESLAAVPLPADGEVLLVVGPEGGITRAELAALAAAGARAVRLGPTVLRASSAAAVALSALGVLTERWAMRPSGQEFPELPRNHYAQ